MSWIKNSNKIYTPCSFEISEKISGLFTVKGEAILLRNSLVPHDSRILFEFYIMI